MKFSMLSIIMFWYEHGPMIDKYRWLFYAGVFVGLFLALIIGLIFYDRSNASFNRPSITPPQITPFKRNKIIIHCLAPFQSRSGHDQTVDGGSKTSSAV